jgi:hypothetical protein
VESQRVLSVGRKMLGQYWLQISAIKGRLGAVVNTPVGGE